MATGADHLQQKKEGRKRGDFRREVNAAGTSNARDTTVSESSALATGLSLPVKRTASGRTSPQTLCVSLLIQTHVQL
jgi:hypothetical protein